MLNNPADAVEIYKTVPDFFDETINWSCPSRGLGEDSIATSTWSATGPDDTLALSSPSISGGPPAQMTTIWIGGGTLDNAYLVTNTITTEGGRILTGTFVVQVVSFVYLTPPRCF